MPAQPQMKLKAACKLQERWSKTNFKTWLKGWLYSLKLLCVSKSWDFPDSLYIRVMYMAVRLLVIKQTRNNGIMLPKIGGCIYTKHSFSSMRMNICQLRIKGSHSFKAKSVQRTICQRFTFTLAYPREEYITPAKWHISTILQTIGIIIWSFAFKFLYKINLSFHLKVKHFLGKTNK